MKKLLLLIIVFVCFVFGAQKIQAAPINPNQNYQVPYIGDVINQEKNPSQSLEKWVIGTQDSKGSWIGRGLLSSVIDGLNCYMLGCPPKGAGTTNNTSPSVLSSLNYGISALYLTRPASFPDYLAQVNFIGKPAYAQITIQGSVGLNGIILLWGIIRNITYVFFVIVMVIIGFMIMLRHKVEPQLVISIQNALPKIAIALLLVTLSYAICGLILDLANLITLLGAYSFQSFHDPTKFPDFDSFLASLLGKGASVNIFTAMWGIGGSAVSSLNTPIKNTIDAITSGIPGLGPPSPFAPIISNLTILILSFAVIGALFKTFFALLSSYINLVFMTIFSPLIFLTSSVPGKNESVEGWFRDFLANALTFPAVFLFLEMGAIISAQPTAPPIDPWYIKTGAVQFTQPWLPFGISGIAVAAGDLIKYLIGFGVVITAPTIPSVVKEMLRSKESALGGGTAQALQGTIQKIPIIGSMLG